MMKGTFICLTNDSGKNYRLTPIGSPTWDRNISEQVSYDVTKDRPYEWSLRLKIGDEIKPGNYSCYATRNVYTLDHQKHGLTSNLLNVKVVGRKDKGQ